MTPLTLFHLPTCPYCHRVRHAADRLGIELNLVDVSRDHDAAQRLIAERGRRTVPVLERPDGTLLGESSDIIDFLNDLAHTAA